MFSNSTTVPLDFSHVPSPKGLPFIGTTLSLILAGGATELHRFMDKRHQDLGPIFKDNVGPVTAVFVSDAEEIRNVFAQEGKKFSVYLYYYFLIICCFLGKYPYHIKPESWLIYNEKHGCSRGLFFMDDEEWLHNRRIMNNILLKGDLKWIEESCEVASELFVDRINKSINREFPKLDEELYKWSMDVVIAVLVGARTYRKSYKDLEPLVRELAAKVFLVFETTVSLQLLSAKFAEKYQIRRWKMFEKSVSEALNIAGDVLKYVQNNFKDSDGLFYKMVQAQVDEPTSNKIIIDLILGAADTTANTLAWSLYLLAKHTLIQNQLREDLKCGKKSVLLKNIVKETLRLYPPAPFLTRYLPESSTVCGYSIPPQTLIVMSIYTSGRDKKYFQDSEKFLPDRWIRKDGKGVLKISASLPFGIGARSCIGKKMAEDQLQDTLAKVVGNFNITLGNTREVKDVIRMITKPSEPIRLIFNKI